MIRLAIEVVEALRFYWTARRIEWRIEKARALRRRALQLEDEAIRMADRLRA